MDSSREDEFIQLLVRNRSQLFGFIFAIVQNVADAEDVLQKTSVVLWEKFASFDQGSNFVAWACHVAKLMSLKHLRSCRRDRLVFSDELIDELTLRRTNRSDRFAEPTEALAGCLEKLPEKDRELIRRCYTQGVTVKQVAEREGRPAGGVYNSLSRIRRVLYLCIRRALAVEAVE